MQTVRVAEANSPAGGLILIAHHRGYFHRYNLDVRLLTYGTGKEALGELLLGKADLATAAETPLVRAAVDGQKYRILSTIGNFSQNLGVIVRKSVVPTPAAIKGKRVGYLPGTTSEVFLESYLAFHHLHLRDIVPVALEAEHLTGAMVDKRTDAIAIWHPYLTEIQAAMEGDSAVYNGVDMRTLVWNLVASEEFMQSPDVAIRFLQALEDAHNYAEQFPNHSKMIVANYTGMGSEVVDGIWTGSDLNLSLRQGLVVSLERHARTLLMAEGKDPGRMPNFLNYIYLDGLLKVSPDTVSVIH